MAVYDKQGNQIDQPYDINGSVLAQCYDIDQNPLLGKSLKVMTYNVGSWYYNGIVTPSDKQDIYYHLQSSIFEAEDVDVVGIQEYYSAIGSYSVPTMLGNYFSSLYTVDKTSSKAGRALASKYTLSETQEINFVHQNGEVRSYLKAYIYVDGKKVCFITAHLAYPSTATAIEQSDELIAVASQDDYCIVTGDFNVNANNSSSSGYLNIVQAWENAGFNSANCADFGFIPTHINSANPSGTWEILDHIFTTPNIDITNAYRNMTKINDDIGDIIDHVPVIAYLNIK